MLKQGRRAGVLIAIAIGIAMLVFEIVELNTNYFRYFPATVVILLGWLLGLGFTKLAAKV
jgi:multisubunit Na+/H+ antiporter MnhB subunit